MVRPTLTEALGYVNDFRMIPVCKEIYSDFITPIQALRKLKKADGHCYMLESMENQERWGRYTFLGYRPKLCVTCLNGKLKVKDIESGIITEKPAAHPGKFISEMLKNYLSPKIEGMPTFTGGFVGYFAYDFIKYSEPKLNLNAKDEEGFNDVDLMLFDRVIAFDNVRQKIMVIVNAPVDNFEGNYIKAVQEIEQIINLIKYGEE